MEQLKSNKKLLLYPTALITILSVILQILTIPIPNMNKAAAVILFIATQIIAPITFFIIVYLMWKEPKPKLKFYKVLLLMLGIMLINIILSIAVSNIVSKIATPPAANPIVESAGNKLPLTILVLGWAMFGEEAIKLSLLFLLFKGLHYDENKKMQYWISWIIVAIIFGLLHLSTYQYNFLQCIFVVGLPAILYGYLWKKTENPIIMWATHYLYDIILILIAYMSTLA